MNFLIDDLGFYFGATFIQACNKMARERSTINEPLQRSGMLVEEKDQPSMSRSSGAVCR
jgi:hypothetical protein